MTQTKFYIQIILSVCNSSIGFTDISLPSLTTIKLWSSVTLTDNAVMTPYRTLPSDVTTYTLKGTVNNNGGIIDLSSAGGSFDTFTIDGNYNGNNGYVIFDTQLNDDTSGTDKLIITGNTSGNTKVKVNNIGGMGAQTLEGIELIFNNYLKNT